MIPATMSAAKIAASMGLPSSVEARALPDPLPPPIPHISNQSEAGLDPAIQSQRTGSQRALAFRMDASRFRKNSPAIPVLQIRKASQNIIQSSSASDLAPTGCESSRCGERLFSASSSSACILSAGSSTFKQRLPCTIGLCRPFLLSRDPQILQIL